jgi:FixJ family two-component response regulator
MSIQIDTVTNAAVLPASANIQLDSTVRGALETMIRSVGCRVSLGREVALERQRGRYAALSRRERQVMALVVQGLLNKLIGAELGISEITVKAHRGRMMRKMEANSVPELVIAAASLSLAPRG